MPSSFSQRNRPVMFSTHIRPPVISSGPESRRFSLGRAQPAPSMGDGRVKLRPKSVEKDAW